MKAHTVTQPWAHLLMHGQAHFVIRSWNPKYRGPILIHAAKSFPPAARESCAVQPLRSILARTGIMLLSNLPRDAMVGTMILEDCLATERELFTALELEQPPLCDMRPGAWAWRLTNPCPFERAIHHAGAIGIFEVELALA